MIPYSHVSTRPPKPRRSLKPILIAVAVWLILAVIGAVWVRTVSGNPAGPDGGLPESSVLLMFIVMASRLWPFGYLVYAAFAFRSWLGTRKERRMQERRAAGLCAQCAYDLRAGHERCPECGYPADVTAGPQSPATIP